MPESEKSAPEPFRRFESLARRLMGVTKGEVDQKEKQRPKRKRKTGRKDSAS